MLTEVSSVVSTVPNIADLLPWMLVFLRLMTACFVGTQWVLVGLLRWHMTIMVAAVTSLLLLPTLAVTDLPAVGVRDVPIMMASEILFGATFGFGIRLWMIGADLCTQLFGQISGLGLVAFRQSGSTATLHRFFQLTWICVLFAAGGHRIAVQCVLDSCVTVPVGSPLLASTLEHSVLEMLGISFALGFKAGLPIATALFLTLVTSAFLARITPHMHLLTTSTGLGALTLVGCLLVGMGPWLGVLDRQVIEFFSTLRESLGVG